MTAYRGTAIVEPRYAVDYYTDVASVGVNVDYRLSRSPSWRLLPKVVVKHLIVNYTASKRDSKKKIYQTEKDKPPARSYQRASPVTE